MWTWADILNWLRRYLRDPDGQIWSDAELLQYWNDCALEIAVKTGPIIRVETYYFPPEYDWSYMFDWEINYGEGTQYQCLNVNQADGWVVSYPWESAYWLDTEPSGDEGYRDIHPWEMCLGSTADVIRMPFHAKFHQAKMIAYDELILDGIHEKHLADQDPYYRTRTGEPSNYWRPDDTQNEIVLYPRPTPTWDETEVYEVLDGTYGGMVADESWLDHADVGVTTDVISTEDTLFACYEAMPVPMADLNDSPDFAPYIVKYVSYATLERAFGADTDGFIPTLRDYWGLRKKAGIEALKKWHRMAKIHQDYRLGGDNRTPRGRHPRLPEHYPAVT